MEEVSSGKGKQQQTFWRVKTTTLIDTKTRKHIIRVLHIHINAWKIK
jgi:hypothetical protein